jgi:cytochrome P450
MRVPQIFITIAGLCKAWIFAALWRTKKMPPGFCNPFESGMFRDQHFILKRARRFGPIFKIIWSRHLMICIVGNELGRRFLKTHERDLQGASIDLTTLFKPGIIRNMAGVPHHDCKQHLVKIFRSEIILIQEQNLRICIASYLETFSRLEPLSQTPQALRTMLSHIVLDCMIILFFGVDRDSPMFKKLRESYLLFGPQGIVWKVGSDQQDAFRVIRICVNQVSSEGFDLITKRPVQSFFGEAYHQNNLSEAIIGNMIYMVEMGRYDISGLLCWVLKYMGESQDLVGQLRSDLNNLETAKAQSLTHAVIYETLRLNQSAALVRKTNHAIEFEGMTIPAQSYIRVCLWESHKDDVHFPNPFKFQPTRFLGAVPGTEKYAPFGMDIHRCLGPDIVLGIVSLFLGELISKYSFKIKTDGPAVLVQTIWEPSLDFSVALAAQSAR